MKTINFLLIYLVLLLFSYCGLLEEDTDTITGTITGTVINGKDSSYLAGVSIIVYNDDLNSSRSISANTNANGTFIIENIEPGLYYLTASKEGYTSSTSKFIKITEGKSSELNFALFITADSTSWVLMPLPSGLGSPRIKDLISLDDNNAWASGSNSNKGFIIKWNGIDWSEQSLPDSISTINALDMHSPMSGYALARIGGLCCVLKYDGSKWSIHIRTSIGSSSGSDIYTVNDSLFFVIAGGNRVVTKEQTTKADGQGVNIYFSSNSEGYLFGFSKCSKYDGQNWAELEWPGLIDMDMCNKNTIYGLKKKHANASYADSLLIIKNGAIADAIYLIDKVYPYKSSEIATYSVSVVDSNDIWIAGGLIASIISNYGYIVNIVDGKTKQYVTDDYPIINIRFHSKNYGWANTYKSIFKYQK